MKLILAADPKGGIGYANGLPWNSLPGDLPRFKALTTGQTVVMGRKTWDSLPRKPLPNRKNIVVSSNPAVLSAEAEVISDVTKIPNDAWLIGGAGLLQSVWTMVDEIHLSLVLKEYKCDTHIDLEKLDQEFYRVHNEAVGQIYLYQIWKRK